MSPRANPLIVAIAFFSGLCSAVYVVAGWRLLRLALGSSEASRTVVGAVFLAGFALGAALVARHAGRRWGPLPACLGLEIAVAVAAAVAPWLAAAAGWIYAALGGVASLGLAGATALRLLLALASAAPAAALLGARLPALEAAAGGGRRFAALLHAAHGAGAAAGAWFLTVWGLELFGLRQTLWLLSAVSLLAAMTVRRTIHGQPAAGQPAAGPAAQARRAPRPGWALAALAALGFAATLVALAWERLLTPLLGATPYVPVVLLAVVFGGLAAGALVRALAPLSAPPEVMLALGSLGLAAPFALGDHLAVLAALFQNFSALGFAGLAFGWTTLAALVALPAATAAGYLLALLGERPEADTGAAWGYLAGGAALGWTSAFLLRPLAAAPELWRTVAAVTAVTALGVAVLAWRRHARTPRLAGALALAFLALLPCRATGPTAFWRHQLRSGPRLGESHTGANALTGQLLSARRSIFHEVEGRESSVALAGLDELTLVVDGRRVPARSGAPAAVGSALVPALLHPAPRRVLVLGLETGTSAGWLARFQGVERVDVVEPEPAVTALSPRFRAASGLADGGVRFFRATPREILSVPSTYELILDSSSWPRADLHTLEAYRDAAERLAPGGLFAQRLRLSAMDARVLELACSTLWEAFAGGVEIWLVGADDLLLVASREGASRDPDRIRRQLAQEPAAGALARIWGVAGPEGFYSAFLGGPELTTELAAATGGAVASDDRPLLELAFTRHTGALDLAALVELSRSLGADRTGLDEARLREAWHVRATVGAAPRPPALPEELDAGEARRREARDAWRRGELGEAIDVWLAQDESPRWPADRLLVAEGLAERGDSRAEAAIAELEPAPAETAFLRARLALRRGDAGAVAGLEEAFAALRRDAWTEPSFAARGLELVREAVTEDLSAGLRLLTALEEPFAVLLLEEQRRLLRLRLGDPAALPGFCVEALDAFEPHVIWERDFLEGRRRCYEEAGHPLAVRAREDLARYLAAAPPDL